jgi:DNA-binding LacI/PurR family transcriptional regulator
LRLTINDIAQLAGVSRSTVSRVLTNHPNVNDRTRKKILRIIQSKGYEPNSIARGFAKGQIRVVSLILSDIRNPIFAEMTWEIQKELRAYSYDVMLFNSNSDPAMEQKFLKMANANRLAGVILFSTNYPGSEKINLAMLNCPIVLINRNTNNPHIDTIQTDNFHGGYIATRHLIDLGHQKIGFLSGKIDMVSHRDRLKGYRKALDEFGIQYYPEYTQTYQDRTIESGLDYAKKLLQQKGNRPTAVFAAGDMMAFGLLDGFRRAGGRVPEDLSIIGFDDIFISSLSGIDLTTVRQPYRTIAKEATQRLITRIAGQSPTVQNIILQADLVLRTSTGKYME